MKRPIAFFGGLLVIIGIVLSLFFNIFGWWNFSISIVFPDRWINAFGGLNWDNSMQNLFDDDSVIEMIPGVIAGIGGIMLLLQSRVLGILGGLLVFAGIGILAYNMLQYDTLVTFVEALNGNIFWWEQDPFLSRIGYGLIMSAAGGLIGILGSLGKKDK